MNPRSLSALLLSRQMPSAARPLLHESIITQKTEHCEYLNCFYFLLSLYIFFPRHQYGEKFFVVHTIIIRNFFPHRVLQRVFQKFSCRFQKRRECISAGNTTCHAGCKQITGPGVAASDIGGGSKRTFRTMKIEVADLWCRIEIVYAYSCDDDGLFIIPAKDPALSLQPADDIFF